MPRLDYKTCKACGKSSAEVGVLSRTRLCAPCGEARLRENIEGIHLHRGPAFLRWRRGNVAAFGGVLLDDVIEALHTDANA